MILHPDGSPIVAPLVAGLIARDRPGCAIADRFPVERVNGKPSAGVLTGTMTRVGGRLCIPMGPININERIARLYLAKEASVGLPDGRTGFVGKPREFGLIGEVLPGYRAAGMLMYVEL